MAKLNAQQLRRSSPTEKDLKKIQRKPIFLVLDRIIDTYNIGSLFRLADAAVVEKIFLCGNMEYPPSSRIQKAAVGTQKWVPWQKKESTLKTVRELKKKGIQILAVEQDSRAVSYKNIKVDFPCAVVCGNETEGLPKKVLNEADIIVEIPMYGINKSFNVWGSTAVVVYKILENLF